MKVVVALPDQPPRKLDLPSFTITTMQQIVGGSFELLSVDDLDIWVCEDGILRGYPPNRIVHGTPLVGTILVTASNPEGDTIDLSDEQALRAIDLLIESPALRV
jgi:hypothetical protein